MYIYMKKGREILFSIKTPDYGDGEKRGGNEKKDFMGTSESPQAMIAPESKSSMSLV
jgi:hypothetical protein